MYKLRPLEIDNQINLQDIDTDRMETIHADNSGLHY